LVILIGVVVLVGLTSLVVLAERYAADPERIWADGQASLRSGRFDEARAAVNRLARLRHPTPLDWMLRGQVALAQERVDDALDALGRVPDGHQIAGQARMMGGQIELRRHRARIAEQLLRDAVRLDQGLVQAHRELIYILGYQLRRAALSVEFEALSRYSELTFDNAFHWCLLRSAHWDPASAIVGLERFIEADPEDRWSRLALAENYRRCGLTGQAEAVIAPLPSDDPEALASRVMLLLDRNQHDEAERLLNSAPADLPALARLRGQIALSHRDGATAVREFRLAEASEPEDRETVFGLVNALTLLGDVQEAALLRERARHIDEVNSLVERAAAPGGKNDLGLLRSLGSACETLGRVREARAWYKLVLAAEPLDQESQQALFRLKSQNKEPQIPAGGPTAPG
jgi:tetratricopeptide (TPR) repeat protein